MRNAIPSCLAALLDASTEEARVRALETFLAEYSDLLLRTARLHGADDDDVMNRYAFIVDELTRSDCRRLRGYVADGRGAFSTWLVIVARRLCLDEHRQRFGRLQASSRIAVERRKERRALVELVSDELQLASVPTPSDNDPEHALRARELAHALTSALETLDVADRLLLRLRFEDDLSAPQIARLTGVPTPFHVYRRLERVLAQLRARLRSAGYDEPVA